MATLNEIMYLRESNLKKEETLGAKYIRQRIKDSLVVISNQIMAWGLLLPRISQTPDLKILKEITEAIDELVQSLHEMDLWLAGAKWRNLDGLKKQLNQANQKWIKSRDAGKLGSYRTWYSAQRQPLKDEPSSRVNQRRDAGQALIELANDLRNASNLL